jgi:hypothetical protein
MSKDSTAGFIQLRRASDVALDALDLGGMTPVSNASWNLAVEVAIMSLRGQSDFSF